MCSHPAACCKPGGGENPSKIKPSKAISGACARHPQLFLACEYFLGSCQGQQGHSNPRGSWHSWVAQWVLQGSQLGASQYIPVPYPTPGQAAGTLAGKKTHQTALGVESLIVSMKVRESRGAGSAGTGPWGSPAGMCVAGQRDDGQPRLLHRARLAGHGVRWMRRSGMGRAGGWGGGPRAAPTPGEVPSPTPAFSCPPWVQAAGSSLHRDPRASLHRSRRPFPRASLHPCLRPSLMPRLGPGQGAAVPGCGSCT